MQFHSEQTLSVKISSEQNVEPFTQAKFSRLSSSLAWDTAFTLDHPETRHELCFAPLHSRAEHGSHSIVHFLDIILEAFEILEA